MNALRRLPYVIAGGAAVGAGAYLLVYLYRWEWHRAIVAGVFLIAIEVGVGIAFVLERLRRLEARLMQQAGAAPSATSELAATRGALRDAEREPSEPFAWLSDSTNRMSVFVPLLLGAGIVLSAMAWIVERVARLTARPTLERGLALRLAPLTVPQGALLAGAPTATFDVPHLGRRNAGRLVVVGFVVLLAGAASSTIDDLADRTQNRPDQLQADSAGRVVLTITNRQAPGANVQAAQNLWGACSNQIGTTYRLTGVEALSGGRVELRVRPAVGKYAERRLRGCLSDATTDLVTASVIEVSAR